MLLLLGRIRLSGRRMATPPWGGGAMHETSVLFCGLAKGPRNHPTQSTNINNPPNDLCLSS